MIRALRTRESQQVSGHVLLGPFHKPSKRVPRRQWHLPTGLLPLLFPTLFLLPGNFEGKLRPQSILDFWDSGRFPLLSVYQLDVCLLDVFRLIVHCVLDSLRVNLAQDIIVKSDEFRLNLKKMSKLTMSISRLPLI